MQDSVPCREEGDRQSNRKLTTIERSAKKTTEEPTKTIIWVSKRSCACPVTGSWQKEQRNNSKLRHLDRHQEVRACTLIWDFSLMEDDWLLGISSGTFISTWAAGPRHLRLCTESQCWTCFIFRTAQKQVNHLGNVDKQSLDQDPSKP